MTTSTSLPSQSPAAQREAGGTLSLPDHYGQTRCVLLPRDPHWMFTYWEISQDTKNHVLGVWGKDIFDRSQSLLRVHDVTGISFHGDNGNSFWDISLSLDWRKYYIQAKDAGRSYCVDVGLLTPEGRFIVLARSNVVTLPAGRVSDIVDDQWMSIGENYERLLKLSGEGALSGSSFEISKLLAHRFELLQTISSWVSSGALAQAPSSFSLAQAAAQQGQKEFWLLLDTSVVLRGITEPGAKITVQGHSVTANKDGVFTAHFPLQDKTLTIPITSVSADGKSQKQFTITIERQTKASA